MRRQDGEACRGLSDNPHPRRRREDRHHHRSDPGPREAREEGRRSPQGAVHRTHLRYQGRSHRRRILPGVPHVGYRPPFHRRHPRGHSGSQPAVRHNRQRAREGQPPQHRPHQDRPQEGHGHERPRVEEHRHRSREGQDPRRSPPRGRIPNHLRFRDLRHPGAVHRPRGPQEEAGEDGRRLHLRREAGDREGPGMRRKHDGHAEGRSEPQPGPDLRGAARIRPRVPVRQHRPRDQQHRRHQGGAEARGLRDHRSRIRVRSGRGEVHGHRLQGVRAQARLRRDRRVHQGAHDPRRSAARRSRDDDR